MDLEGKVVLLTGASGGLGQAMAAQLGEKGARLVLTARRREVLDRLAAGIDPAGKRACAISGDVSSEEDCRRVVQQGVAFFGGLDILINNAGLGCYGPVEELPAEHLDRVIRTNICGLVYMVQQALPHLKKTKGMIVNVSSGLGKRALPMLGVYAGSKSMINGISEALRLEVRKYGVKVLNYCPSEIRTGFYDNAMSTRPQGDIAKDRKMAEPEEVSARLLRAVEREKREVVEGKFLAVMNFYAPGLLDRMFARMAGD